MIEVQILNGKQAKIAVPYHSEMLTSDLVECVYREELNGPDTCTVAYRDAERIEEIRSEPTLYVRILDGSDRRTYLVRNPSVSHGDTGAEMRLEGERIWIHLLTRYLYGREVAFSNIGLSDLVYEILHGSGADSEFDITVPEGVVDFFEIGIYTPPLLALRNVAKKMGLTLALDESDGLTLALSTPTLDTSNVVRYGSQLSGVERTIDLSDRVTRVYAVGGGEPPLTLAQSPLSGGQEYIDAPSYSPENHIVGVYKNESLYDWENVIPAAKNPDFSGDYTGGVADGWSKIGSPTCEKETDITFFEHGNASQKVVTAGAAKQGIECTYPGVAGQVCVRWSHIYIASIDADAKLFVECTSKNKRAYNIIHGSTQAAGKYVTITRLGMALPSETQSYRIYTEGGGATFYVDAVLVALGSEFRGFVIGSMADTLYREALAELSDKALAGVSYTLTAPTAQLSLGSVVRVEDEIIGAADLRVTDREIDVLWPSQSSYRVGAVIRRDTEHILSDLLDRERVVTAEQRRRARASKVVAAQAELKGGTIEFFTGNYTEVLPSDRAHLTAGHIYTEGDNRYDVPAFNGAQVGYNKTLYIYLDEIRGSLHQTEDVALASNHSPLYQIQTPPASQPNTHPKYTPLFHPAPPALTLDAPILTLSVSSRTIRAVWSSVINATGYNARYRKVGIGTRTWTTRNSVTSPLNITGLDNGSEYEVEVRATAVNFADSDWTIARATPVAPKLPAPNFISLSSHEPNSLLGAWSDSPNARGYEVEYRRVGSSVWLIAPDTTSPTVITRLTTDREYEVRVRAVAAGFRDSDWETRTATVSKFTLSAPAFGDGSINTSASGTLTAYWSSVINATGYNARHRKAGTQTWKTENNVTSPHNITGLDNGSEYEVQIQATSDVYANSDWSATGSKVPLPQFPGFPFDLSGGGTRRDGNWFWVEIIPPAAEPTSPTYAALIKKDGDVASSPVLRVNSEGHRGAWTNRSWFTSGFYTITVHASAPGYITRIITHTGNF